MAVFTEISLEEAAALFMQLNLGQLHTLQGCQGGIENTNYFASGDQGEFVLTVFERLSFEQLPFYLNLMQHLAQRGIAVPAPQADAQGQILHRLQDKPAAVVQRLTGSSVMTPDTTHCAAVGDMLARMHLAGRDYLYSQPNLRGLAWWNDTAPEVLPFLDASQSQLLQSELAYQNHIATSSNYQALPRGPIHADLFRDNVMFDSERLSGFFDFYFAGVDTWLFDIAVCLNDWCIDWDSGAQHRAREGSFIQAYTAVRPLTRAEHTLLPALLRAGALRFWLSRLWDLHLPRQASVLKAHDPAHFERVLRQRLAQLSHHEYS